MNTDIIIANFFGLALSKCFTCVNSSKPSGNQQNHAEVDVFIGSIFQVGKLRHRRLSNFLQGNRARKQHSNNVNPDSPASESDTLSVSSPTSLGKGGLEVGRHWTSLLRPGGCVCIRAKALQSCLTLQHYGL